MTNPVDSEARNSGLVWAIVLTGIALPWICGAGVKIYLDFSGMPTWPWSAFLSPFQLAFLLPATAWISLPFFVLAYAAHKLLPVDFLGLVTPRSRSAFFIGGLLGGALGAIWVFVRMFWLFDFLELLMPQWLGYLPHMVAGLVLGYFAGRQLGHGPPATHA